MTIHSARVVGTGSIGYRHLRVLSKLMRHRTIAVPIRGIALPTEWGAIAEFEPYGLRPRQPVELSVIASRTARHVTDALEYQSDSEFLLIEKPVSASSDQASELLNLPSPERVTIASPLKFMQGFAAFKQIIKEVNSIHTVDVHCESWLPDWRPTSDFRDSYSADPDEGGVMRDLVHEIDYCLSLFSKPIAVSALVEDGKDIGISADAHAVLTWKYPNFNLNIFLSFLSRNQRRRIRVQGDFGSVTWDILKAQVIVKDTNGKTVSQRTFLSDLNRDSLLVQQLIASASGMVDDRITTVAGGIYSLKIIELARQSSGLGGKCVMLTE